jgi:hypothetical protein
VASSNWKKVELEHCREVGGERTGPRGYGLPDCIGTPGLALEIKAYKRFTFLTEDWNQAVENAARMKATPALLVREGGRGGRKQLQMRETDFGRWWARSGLRPIRLHVQDVERGLVRFDWSDFVRLYRAYMTKEEAA